MNRKIFFFPLLIFLLYFVFLLFFFFKIGTQAKTLYSQLNNFQFDKAEQTNESLKKTIGHANIFFRPLPKINPVLSLEELIAFANQSSSFLTNAFNFKEKSGHLFNAVLNAKTKDFQKLYPSWQQEYQQTIYQTFNLFDSFTKVKNNPFFARFVNKAIVSQLDEKITKFRNQKDFYINLAKVMDLLLAVGGEKKYLVLLQNNMELRPTGGFMGSYGLVTLDHGVITDIQIQDIYVPDGQIKGHVEPPPAIQQAFGLGEWRLRDANFDPHFPAGAKTILWFFEKGGVKNIDGIIALNLNITQDILAQIGNLKLADYEEEVSSDNLYQLAQYYAETDFFPGSTQKKDFLTSLAKALVEKLKTIEADNYLKSGSIIIDNLNRKEILLYFNGPYLQDFFSKQNWDGAIQNPACASKKDCLADSLAIIEANLGANKANCCLTRQTGHLVSLSPDGRLLHQVILELENKNKTSHPNPPAAWGGRYVNYLRFYIPRAANVEKVMINNTPLSKQDVFITTENDELQSIGFFANVAPLTKKKIELLYSFEKGTSNKLYQLKLNKQPGIKSSPQIITIDLPHKLDINDERQEETKNTSKIEINLERDELISFVIF